MGEKSKNWDNLVFSQDTLEFNLINQFALTKIECVEKLYPCYRDEPFLNN